MVSRHWTGLCRHERAADYVEHLRTETFQALSSIPGFLRASILRREIGEGTEFRVVTDWRSLEDIEAFSGPDLGMAVVPTVVQEMMLRYDERVVHYEFAFGSE